jgi:cell wall-associated NlpC family hydrolase
MTPNNSNPFPEKADKQNQGPKKPTAPKKPSIQTPSSWSQTNKSATKDPKPQQKGPSSWLPKSNRPQGSPPTEVPPAEGKSKSSRIDGLKNQIANKARQGAAQALNNGLMATTGIPPAIANRLSKVGVKVSEKVVKKTIPIVLIFILLLSISVVAGIGGATSPNLGAPYNKANALKTTSQEYLNAYINAASKTGVPWTILEALTIYQTDQGRYSPYDTQMRLDKSPSTNNYVPIDRDPNRQNDIYAANFSEFATADKSFQGATDYACSNGYCGPQPEIGNNQTPGAGPLLIRPGVAAANGFNPQDLNASLNFIAQKMETIAQGITQGGTDTAYQSDPTQADNLWTQVGNSLGIYLADPTGAASCVANLDPTASISSLIATIWPCELAQSPNLYVVTGTDFSKGLNSPTYATTSGAQAINLLTSEAQAVATAVNGACTSPSEAYTQGVFPLTQALAKKYGVTNRCDSVSNIAAAAKAVASIEQVPPAQRSVGGGPFAPMLGGWLTMPEVFGSELSALENSPGPYQPFNPSPGCASGIVSWITSLSQVPNSPLLTEAPIPPTTVYGYLTSPSTPQSPLLICDNVSLTTHDSNWDQLVASEILSYDPTATPPLPSSTVTSLPGSPVPYSISTKTTATTSPTTTTSQSPTTTTSQSPTTTTVPLTSSQKTILSNLEIYFSNLVKTDTPVVTAAQWPQISPIPRLSLNGVGVPLDNINNNAQVTTSSSIGTTLVQYAINLGGDYPGDTRTASLGTFLGTSYSPSALAIESIPSAMLGLYQTAAATCPGLPWTVLAGIGTVESSNGQSNAPGVHLPPNLSPSQAIATALSSSGIPYNLDPSLDAYFGQTYGTNYAGAAGPMQMGIGGASSRTFFAYQGPVAADEAPTPPAGANPPNPWDPIDAVYAATRMLCSNLHPSGPTADITAAILRYNDSQAYVNEVLGYASQYASTSTTSSAQAEEAIAFATSNLGVEYTWGGNNTSTGFDCSGLIQAAYASASPPINLPHNAELQYLSSTPVNLGSIQPGDLLFFGSSVSDIVHVGLYVGNGQMIDAPHSGATVELVNDETNIPGWFVAAANPLEPQPLPPGATPVP